MNLKQQALKHFDARARAALRVEVQRLQGLIKRLRAERAAALRKASTKCASSKGRASAAAKRLQEQARAEGAKLRGAAAASCKRRRNRAAQTNLNELVNAYRELAETRAYARLYKPTRKGGKATRAERREESNAEVERNLPPELITAWRAVRDSISGTSRKTRTEAFLDWAHDNPDELADLSSDASERGAHAEIAAHEKRLAAVEQRLHSRKPLRPDDWETLGIKPRELEALGLVPTDAHDVAEYLDLRSRDSYPEDDPF